MGPKLARPEELGIPPGSIAAYEHSPGFLTALRLTLHGLRHPLVTFGQMEPAGSVILAALYGITVGSLVLILSTVMVLGQVMSVLDQFPPDLLQQLRSFTGWNFSASQFEFTLTVATAVYILISSVGTLIALSIIFHLMLGLVGKRRGSFGATFRVVAYSTTSGFLELVPVVGLLLGAISFTLQQITGLARVHGMAPGRVALAMSLPFFILLALALLPIFLIR
jgi:hypothetical protein